MYVQHQCMYTTIMVPYYCSDRWYMLYFKLREEDQRVNYNTRTQVTLFQNIYVYDYSVLLYLKIILGTKLWFQ